MADDIKESFTRQRRNLLVMLGGIFLTYYWELDFKTINLVGNEAVLGDSRDVYPVLWVLLLYWYWRFESLLHDLGDLGLTDIYINKRNRIFEIWTRKPRHMKKAYRKSLEFHDTSGLNTEKMKLDGPYIESDTPLIGSYLIDVMFQRENSTSWEKRRTGMVLPKPDSVMISIKTVIYLTFKTRLFSEYFLPRLMTWLFVMYWFLCHFEIELLI